MSGSREIRVEILVRTILIQSGKLKNGSIREVLTGMRWETHPALLQKDRAPGFLIGPRFWLSLSPQLMLKAAPCPRNSL